MSSSVPHKNGIAKQKATWSTQTSQESLANIITSILDDCIYNIIHDNVLAVHRSEKIARQQAAAIIAEQAVHGQSEDGSPVKGAVSSAPAALGKVETLGAVYEHGRITLLGNPLITTKEVICPQCRLPRLLYPTSGAGKRAPEAGKTYCTRHPYISRPGHDIYGLPFSTDVAKTKKEREALKAQSIADQKRKDGTPADREAHSLLLANLQVEKASRSTGIWHTCPSCKRSLQITRFAQHLEKCLGIAGRASGRAAMARLQSGTGTPSAAGSRAGTPALNGSMNGGSKKERSPTKRERDTSNDNDEAIAGNQTPKKKMRRTKKESMGRGSLLEKGGKAKDVMKGKLMENAKKNNNNHNQGRPKGPQRQSSFAVSEKSVGGVDDDDDEDGEGEDEEQVISAVVVKGKEKGWKRRQLSAADTVGSDEED